MCWKVKVGKVKAVDFRSTQPPLPITLPYSLPNSVLYLRLPLPEGRAGTAWKNLEQYILIYLIPSTASFITSQKTCCVCVTKISQLAQRRL
jgi:hypothetical protein